MSKWAQIENSNDRFRLLCSNSTCSLSIANLLNGMLSISTIHGSARHSTLLSDEDMKFIVSQYLNNLSIDEREKMLEFFENF